MGFHSPKKIAHSYFHAANENSEFLARFDCRWRPLSLKRGSFKRLQQVVTALSINSSRGVEGSLVYKSRSLKKQPARCSARNISFSLPISLCVYKGIPFLPSIAARWERKNCFGRTYPHLLLGCYFSSNQNNNAETAGRNDLITRELQKSEPSGMR